MRKKILVSSVDGYAAPVPSQGYSIFNETMVDMTWPEVDKAAKNGAIILLPTGVIEEHGPHLCLGVDTYLVYIFCKLVRQKLKMKGVETLIAPPFYWGITAYRPAYPGSFSCRPETVKAVLYDELACFKEWGFLNVFAFTWHQEPTHGRTIMEAVKEARSGTGIRAYYVIRPRSAHAKRFGLTGKEEHVIIVPGEPQIDPPSEYVDVHAGRRETGEMLAYFPELANAELAKTLKSNDKTPQEWAEWARSGLPEMRTFLGQGYVGAPADFDAGTSMKGMEEATTRTADTIESFLKGTYVPPEIK